MKWFILALVMLLAVSASADPVISSIYTSGSNSFVTGDTITITGSGFGTKSPALPVLWDDFEDGAEDVQVITPEIGSRDYAQSDGIYYASADPYTGLQTHFSHAPTHVLPYDQIGLVYQWGNYEATDVFSSVKVKGSNGAWYAPNTKNHRINSSGIDSGDYAHGTPNFDIGKNRARYYIDDVKVNHGILGQTSLSNTGFDAVTIGSWHSVSMWAHCGDKDVANGYVGYNVDNYYRQVENVATLLSTFQTGYPYADGYSTVCFFEYSSNEPADDEYDLELDEVYADTTMARSYAYSTDPVVYESMLLPLTWSDTEITALFNQGTASAGEILQVKVVDRDGVLSADYPVTVGGTVIEPPGPPGQPVNVGAVEN